MKNYQKVIAFDCAHPKIKNNDFVEYKIDKITDFKRCKLEANPD